MDLDYQTLLTQTSRFVWPMFRISGLLLSAPVFSSAVIPVRIRVVFIFALSVICAPLVPAQLSFVNFTGWYIVYVLQEIALGVLMGFSLQFVFQIFILSGQIISLQAGLSFAMMVDPATNVNVPLIGQFYLMMTTLIFLALDGHLALLKILYEGFQIMPIGHVQLENSMVWDLLTFSGWMFKEAVLISIPAILSLLMVTLSFGIMTRVAPQLNIFSLGFPITLLMAMIVLKVTLPMIAARIIESLEEGMNFIMRIFH